MLSVPPHAGHCTQTLTALLRMQITAIYTLRARHACRASHLHADCTTMRSELCIHVLAVLPCIQSTAPPRIQLLTAPELRKASWALSKLKAKLGLEEPELLQGILTQLAFDQE
ncbi:hypothetical protein DUNSADRAFT_13715 [Dunaliella salina]|uniref:Encoded protein n=1 Tax=Dunaliella salina TaxID=3046 RepID=A0ABQ7H378_DUNSA|nr:hypothetical protein DUNSADRAFT_13715 [Dunaliella salina]|eukprot:KAF5841261.1 hypothetical protein DUNSADRAFT_13715 [Dunaliella salina]